MMVRPRPQTRPISYNGTKRKKQSSEHALPFIGFSIAILVLIMLWSQQQASLSPSLQEQAPPLRRWKQEQHEVGPAIQEGLPNHNFGDPDCVLDEENEGYYGHYAYDDSEEEESEEEDESRRRLAEKSKGDDPLTLGRCRYKYPTRVEPKEGFLKAIDFYFFRDLHKKREECYLKCMDALTWEETTDEALLNQAVTMGLTRVVEKLMNKPKAEFNVNPLKVAPFTDRPNLNAIQEAIRGGYAEMVAILTKKNSQLVIDAEGRTVETYVKMQASPIRPDDAEKYLQIKVQDDGGGTAKEKRRRRLEGWHVSESSSNKKCDIPIVTGNLSRADFYHNYFVPGRPFVWRGQVPEQEVRAFDKARWTATNRFNPSTKVTVGPTAYPNLTNQKNCKRKFSIQQLENAKFCKEQPGIPMLHARHPSEEDLQELFPRYQGDLYHESSSWFLLEQLFGKEAWKYSHSWQVFFGGSESGATLHWHLAAFNALYVGTKDWAITPPHYRGWTGMPAKQALEHLPKQTLYCTQKPGDLMYIPDYWGHLTYNQGFSIGAAVIMPLKFQKMASPQSKHAPQLNREQKVLFVHINKAGGTSMIRTLTENCPTQYLSGRWELEEFHRSFHASAISFIDRFGRYEWDTAYTFAVVRHPLARQVSNFFFLMDLCKKKSKPDFCDDRLIPSLPLSKMTDEDKIEAFHSYTQALYKQYPPGSKEHYLFGSRGHGNEEYPSFNATQTSWLVDRDDKIVVKHIFQLESLENDFEKLKTDVPCLAKADQQHVNKSPKYPDYTLFGKNKKTNKILREIFDVDFQNFGYKL